VFGNEILSRSPELDTPDRDLVWRTRLHKMPTFVPHEIAGRSGLHAEREKKSLVTRFGRPAVNRPIRRFVPARLLRQPSQGDKPFRFIEAAAFRTGSGLRPVPDVQILKTSTVPFSRPATAWSASAERAVS
jgi:hypothetical protein